MFAIGKNHVWCIWKCGHNVKVKESKQLYDSELIDKIVKLFWEVFKILTSLISILLGLEIYSLEWLIRARTF